MKLGKTFLGILKSNLDLSASFYIHVPKVKRGFKATNQPFKLIKLLEFVAMCTSAAVTAVAAVAAATAVATMCSAPKASHVL